MTRQIIIACSVRPDNRGGANASDMKALAACQKLFSDPIRIGKDLDDLKIVVRRVPSSLAETADIGNAGVVQAARQNAMDGDMMRELNGVDLLYIPGAPVAPVTQPTDQHKMKASSKFKKTEAISRDAYESVLIEKAMTIGIPVLAVCAGSWRLLEAFGGGVRELSAEEVGRHYGGGWNQNHGLTVETSAKGVLPGAARATLPDAARASATTTDFKGANTTHWAVANTDRSGGLAKHGPAQTRASAAMPAPVTRGPTPPHLQGNAKRRWNAKENKAAREQTQKNHDAHGATPGRQFRNPNDLLAVMVREGTSQQRGTVEGYESRHGAPVVGVQWHPESFLPDMKGNKETYKNDATIDFSRNIFMQMVLAALASQTRRTATIPALKEAFEKVNFGLRRAQAPKVVESCYAPDPI